MAEETQDYWHSLDTSTLYLPSELLAYHLYLLEKARKDKNAKEEKREIAIIAFYKKRQEKEMEDTLCLKM